MKKLISGISALAIMTMPLTAFATANPTTINQNSDPKQGQTVLSTSIDPTYIVTIPADTQIAFNATSTSIGKVELTQAQLDPGKLIRVSVNSDGELNNAADDAKVIPYVLMAQYASGEVGEEYVPFNTSGEPLEMNTQGQAFDMTVEITEENWNKAYAGQYGDTVLFNVEYTDADPDPRV